MHHRFLLPLILFVPLAVPALAEPVQRGAATSAQYSAPAASSAQSVEDAVADTGVVMSGMAPGGVGSSEPRVSSEPTPATATTPLRAALQADALDASTPALNPVTGAWPVPVASSDTWVAVLLRFVRDHTAASLGLVLALAAACWMAVMGVTWLRMNY